MLRLRLGSYIRIYSIRAGVRQSHQADESYDCKGCMILQKLRITFFS